MNDSERGSRTRKTIIDITRRRYRPVAGAGNEQRALMEMPPRVLWPDLRDVLAGIPWAVAGAVATRAYMPERATSDLDVVVLPQDADRAAARLTAHRYTSGGPLPIDGRRWRNADGLPIDVLEGREPWWPEALAAGASNGDVQGLPTLTLPYLVLMKLVASRLVDMGDLGRMLGLAADTQLADVRRIVSRYAPTLSEDLESLIQLGKLEMEG